MLISLEQMHKIHNIQLEMFKELQRVMEVLNVKYFFIHGSLLGALKYNSFIEEDDDIDIALFRNDYNKLICEGNSIISSKYFIQSSMNDDFPLAFAKVRKCNTSFIQPVLKNYKCNKGIYIDVFPIDFEHKNKKYIFEIKKYFLDVRINRRLLVTKTIKGKIIELLSIFIYPSYENAVFKREKLYSSIKNTEYISIFSGKDSERRMQFQWFRKEKKIKFCDIEVNCPWDTEEYLSRIYGFGFIDYNPAELRISNDKKIEISASMIDLNDC